MPDNATFYWNELVTEEVDEAKKFYTTVLGWTLEEMPMPSGGKYTVAKMGGKPVGGIMSSADIEGGDELPSHWMSYIHVADVDAVVAKVAKAGGEIAKPCFDVPGVGRIAIIEDPTGAMIGIMTAAPGA
jgi:uncharacterized protein